MNILEYLIPVLIATASFLLQIWPRIKNRYFGIDTWRFLLLADYIRRYKRLPEVVPDTYIIETPVDNPPLLPLLLSTIKKNFLEKNQWLVSPIIDFVTNISVFVLTYILTQNFFISYLAQVIYTVTPVVPLEASNISLRTISNLIFSWTVIFSVFYVKDGNLLYFMLAILFVIILSYTHRMSIQVLFFFFMCMSIVDKNVEYFKVLFIGLFFSIILFKGYYLKLLRGHLLMISFWMYNIENRVAHQIRGNPSKSNVHTDFVRHIEYLIQKIPIFPMLGVNPWMILVFIFVYLHTINNIFSPADVILLLPYVKWAIFSFFLAVLFNTKLFRFLGEGQRYLEYGTIPTAIISAYLLHFFANNTVGNKNIVIVILGAVIFVTSIVLIIMLQKKVVLNNPDKSVTPSLMKIIDYLNKKSEIVRIACIPHGLADIMAYFLKNKRVLLSDNSIGVWKLGDFWPLVKKPLNEIFEKFDVNYLLVSENYVRLEEIKLKNFKVEFASEKYVLLRKI